jgi:hypothetical protein
MERMQLDEALKFSRDFVFGEAEEEEKIVKPS